MMIAEIFNFGFVQRALITGSAHRRRLLHTGSFSRPAPPVSSAMSWPMSPSARGCRYLIGFSPFYAALAALPLVMLSSLAILQLTRSRRIHGDAAIGIVSSVGIALGVIMASLSGGYNADLLSYLFGNILTATQTELVLSLIIFFMVILFVAFLYPDLFAVTFDEEMAKSMKSKRTA